MTRTSKISKEEILEENLALLFAIGERVRSKKGDRIWRALQQFISSRPKDAVRYGSKSPFKDDLVGEPQLRPAKAEPVVSIQFLLMENAQLREIIEQEACGTMPMNWKEALWPSARTIFETSYFVEENTLRVYHAK